MGVGGGATPAAAGAGVGCCIALAVTFAEARTPLVPPPDLNYWSGQKTRFHLAGAGSVGLPTQALLSAGYGKPHWTWVGVSADALLANSFGAFSAGPRFHLLMVNGYFGVRRTLPYARRVAVLAENYVMSDFQDDAQPLSNYTALDAELWGYVPLSSSFVSWGVRGIHIVDFPHGQALHSEYLRYVLHDDVALFGRAGWYYKLSDGRWGVGPASDAVLSPDRAPTVRLGGGFFYQISTHLQGQFLLTMPVTSPDPRTSAIDKAWGGICVRYAWASGEPSPGFF